jgi:hypothetical protein
MTEHDSGYKLLFSHPKMVEELLRGFVRESWIEDLDFGSLEQVNESFTSDDLQQRYGAPSSQRSTKTRSSCEFSTGGCYDCSADCCQGLQFPRTTISRRCPCWKRP